LKDECRKLGAHFESPESSNSSSPMPIRAARNTSQSTPQQSRPIEVSRPPVLIPRKNSISSMTDQPINGEYLKAVLLKFLDAHKSKDTRSQLISVIGMLLNFSPDEAKQALKSKLI
jgi:hypothetical protein